MGLKKLILGFFILLAVLATRGYGNQEVSSVKSYPIVQEDTNHDKAKVVRPKEITYGGLFVDATNYLYYESKATSMGLTPAEAMLRQLDSIQLSGFIHGIRLEIIMDERRSEWLDKYAWVVDEAYKRGLGVIPEINEQITTYSSEDFKAPFNDPDFSNEAIRAFDSAIREMAKRFNGINGPYMPIWIVLNEPNIPSRDWPPEVTYKILANTYLSLRESGLGNVTIVGPGLFVSKISDLEYMERMLECSTAQWMEDNGYPRQPFILGVNLYPARVSEESYPRVHRHGIQFYSELVEGWVKLPGPVYEYPNDTCEAILLNGKTFRGSCTRFKWEESEETLETLVRKLRRRYGTVYVTEFGFENEKPENIIEALEVFKEHEIPVWVLYKWDQDPGNPDSSFGIASPDGSLTPEGKVIQQYLLK